MTSVVVLDYGSGNVRSVVRMLERVGAQVELTADPAAVAAADGLYVPGVGNFHACMAGLAAVGAGDLIRQRLARGSAVLGVCVGYQVLFAGSTERSSVERPGLGFWPGVVERLRAPVVPHMGWSEVAAGEGSTLLAGLGDERFYFVHSYAPLMAGRELPAGVLSTADHGATFLAAVEDGPLCGTQFHPEKSGDAGAALVRNWLNSL
ncbi:imidazole glycerol phosphate synthase subunit HisH [Calidifontibacter terrae]